jgi:thiaminase
MNGDNPALNPERLENAIQEIARRMHTGIKVVSELNESYKAAKRAHDVAKAQAYVDHVGAQAEKKQVAELAVVTLRVEMDEAKVKLDYAQDLARTLHKELSALQSLNSNVREMYRSERGFGS